MYAEKIAAAEAEAEAETEVTGAATENVKEQPELNKQEIERVDSVLETVKGTTKSVNQKLIGLGLEKEVDAEKTKKKEEEELLRYYIANERISAELERDDPNDSEDVEEKWFLSKAKGIFGNLMREDRVGGERTEVMNKRGQKGGTMLDEGLIESLRMGRANSVISVNKSKSENREIARTKMLGNEGRIRKDTVSSTDDREIEMLHEMLDTDGISYYSDSSCGQDHEVNNTSAYSVNSKYSRYGTPSLRYKRSHGTELGQMPASPKKSATSIASIGKYEYSQAQRDNHNQNYQDDTQRQLYGSHGKKTPLAKELKGIFDFSDEEDKDVNGLSFIKKTTTQEVEDEGVVYFGDEGKANIKDMFKKTETVANNSTISNGAKSLKDKLTSRGNRDNGKFDKAREKPSFQSVGSVKTKKYEDNSLKYLTSSIDK
ncbi:hypothetical protein AX774_g4641, partial [Zancudomyces culisetae]